jgi:hypothetical protein
MIDRAAAGMKHDVDGGVHLRSQNNRAGRPSVFENMTSSASKETEPRMSPVGHKADMAAGAADVRFQEQGGLGAAAIARLAYQLRSR